MIKHDSFENFAKSANLGKDKNENFKCQIYYGIHFILTSFTGEEIRFFCCCFFFQYLLVCATELIQYTTNGKVHWVILKLFIQIEKVDFSETIAACDLRLIELMKICEY